MSKYSFNHNSLDFTLRNLDFECFSRNETSCEFLESASRLCIELLPLICVFGVLTNLVNITVFCQPKLSDRSFKYMLSNSISNSIYLGLYLFNYYVLDAGGESGVTGNYSGQLFFRLVDDYLSSVFAFFGILNDIFLSAERLALVTNKRTFNKISFKLIISSCIALSLAIYSPVLLMSQIRLVPGSTNQYQSKLTAFGASLQGHATLVFLSFLRIVLAIVILSILNIITTFRLKSHLKKKMISNVSLIKEVKKRDGYDISFSTQNSTVSMNVTASKNTRSINAYKSNRNITLMVIWTCFLYIFGTAPYTLAYILTSYFVESSPLLYTYTMVSLAMLFVAHSFNFFVYFSFNKLFRGVIFSFFRSIAKSSNISRSTSIANRNLTK